MAGSAAVEMTPKGPIHLAGYPHCARISTGVHDPLLASALLLREGRGGVLLVALDLLFVDPPTARKLRRVAAARARLNEDAVLITCTHTHSGPLAGRMFSWDDGAAMTAPDPAFIERLQDGVISATARAAGLLEPAELAWTSARADGIGGNRRDPAGTSDPEVGILAVRHAGTGRPVAVDITYSMHPTVLHEDSTLVSSDFPHYLRRAVVEACGDQTVVYHTGPAGDQSPRHYVGAQTFAEAERMGRALGERIVERLADVRKGDYSRQVELRGIRERVELPLRSFPSLEDARGRLALARLEYERLESDGAERPRVRTAECAVFGAERAVLLSGASERGEIEALAEARRRAEVQALLIGPAALAGLPGELFVAYGLEVKRAAPIRTFVAGLANGDLQGYIVTPEAAAEGGYEAEGALLAPESGHILAKSAVDLIGRLTAHASLGGGVA